MRDARGGKLYDSRFGVRGNGEGVYAGTIRTLFDGLARKYGLELAKMKLVPLQSLTNVASALKGGRIEAALLPATSARPLLDDGDAELLGWVGDETPWQLGAVFVGTATNAKHELVARLLAGYRGGTRDFHDRLLAVRRDGKVLIDDRTRPFLDMIAKYINLPPEKVTTGLPYVNPDAVIELASVADQLAWMQREKFVDAGYSVSDIVEARYGYAK